MDIEKNLLQTKSIKFLEFVNFESSSYREKVQFSIERILLAFDLVCIETLEWTSEHGVAQKQIINLLAIVAWKYGKNRGIIL